MKIIELPEDITVFYVTATSFPEDALPAHEKLHSLFPYSSERKYFGISRPEQGGYIVYKAAAEELEMDEGKKYGCQSMILRKGKYISTELKNFTQDPVNMLSHAFEILLQHPQIDPRGYCVEWFQGPHDVICMIRLNEQ
jgi:hypothetical protein